MSKAVLISIQPKWCEKIARGEKTIEVRKNRPKLEPPFKCYIYCTKPKFPHEDFICFFDGRGGFYAGGKVIGEFVCDNVLDISILCSDPNMKGLPFPGTGLTDREIMDYLGNGKAGHGWHISDLMIYDKPKELSEFRLYECRVIRENGYPIPTHEIGRPPQSWCYVEEAKKRAATDGETT